MPFMEDKDTLSDQWDNLLSSSHDPYDPDI